MTGKVEDVAQSLRECLAECDTRFGELNTARQPNNRPGVASIVSEALLINADKAYRVALDGLHVAAQQWRDAVDAAND